MELALIKFNIDPLLWTSTLFWISVLFSFASLSRKETEHYFYIQVSKTEKSGGWLSVQPMFIANTNITWIGLDVKTINS